MNDKDRRIICFRYMGTVFVLIEVVEGFQVFKDFAEDREIAYDGIFTIVDEDPYYFIDFNDITGLSRFIEDMRNS